MDKASKVLIALVAMGLWANAGVSMLRNAERYYGATDIATIESDLRDLSLSMRLITDGTCKNTKVC